MSGRMPYTADEFREFDELTADESSPDQMDRIRARLKLRSFITKHGAAKCDAMFAAIKERDTKRKAKA